MSEAVSPYPGLDAVSRAYVTLAFGIERHAEGLVDAYVGPPEIRDAVLAAPVEPPDALLARAEALLGVVAAADLTPSRVDYLTAQVRALATICRRLNGELIGYTDEVRLLFDIEPERVHDAVLDEAIVALDDALPGEGDVAARMIAWRERFEIPAETARTLIDVVMAEVRRRTLAPLPDGEGVEIAMVQDKPWSAYNWYLGNCRSLVEVNTDLPVRANALLGLICHEGYPGHHTEHAVKEQRLYRQRGYGEHAIQLINTPECVISEGIAVLAESVIFADEEAARWRAERLYRPLGLPVDPHRELQIVSAQRNLRSIGSNAALLMHEDGASPEDVIAYIVRYGLETPERARQRLRFIESPLWRAYIFTYHVGGDLLDRWLEQEGDGTPVSRAERFGHLLEAQVTPSAIRGQLD